MPSIKDLKKRIGSVKNTQQTTKAMKMVSAAKLRRAQDAISNQRPYARKIGELIALVSELALTSGAVLYSAILLRTRDVEEMNEGKKVLLVAVTSDRGLCGGFNSNVIKATQRWIRENESKGGSVELAFVGKKGYDYFKTKKVKVRQYYHEVGGKVTFPKAKVLADNLVDLFLTGEFDEIKFVYNEFKNAVSQTVVIENLLPVPKPAAAEGDKKESVLPMYIVKPELPEMLEMLLSKNFAIQTFRVMLESQASEHGARMSAMENATKNAGEMIRKLTLQFNKQRQAGITKELLEIISGSESQKNTG